LRTSIDFSGPDSGLVTLELLHRLCCGNKGFLQLLKGNISKLEQDRVLPVAKQGFENNARELVIRQDLEVSQTLVPKCKRVFDKPLVIKNKASDWLYL